MNALIRILAGDAKARRENSEAYIAPHSIMAEMIEPVLARKMQAVFDAQEELDLYVLARTESR